MMHRKSFLGFILAGAASLAFSASAMAAVMWDQPSGTTSTFKYSNGQNVTNEFGSPTLVTSEGFFFAPLDFTAVSTNGSTGFERDTFQVKVESLNGDKTITQIKLNEGGDYTIDNGGGVKAQGGMMVQVVDPVYSGQRTYMVDLSTNPNFVLNATDADGVWTGNITINLTAPAAAVIITYNNQLQSHSNAGGSALIQKKFLGDLGSDDPGLVIGTNNVPEPTTMAAILGGLGIAAARRRKA